MSFVPLLTTDYDLIVLGAGAGGMTAAVVASILGCKVIVLEKTEYVGGTMAVSGGTMWIPAAGSVAQEGTVDTREAITTYLRAVLGNRFNAAMVDNFLDNGPEMIAFMTANTEVRFARRPLGPDYQSDLPGANRGRTLESVPYDGRVLKKNFSKLRPPLASHMVLGGMQVSKDDIKRLLNMFGNFGNFAHATKLALRQGIDRLGYPRGTRLIGGNALAARLYKSLLDRNVSVVTQTQVDELVVTDGQVTGVTGRCGTQAFSLRAGKGVVLATGGFPGSAQFRAQYMPHADEHWTAAPQTNVGDGITLATRIGADLKTTNAGAAFWTPISILRNPDGSDRRFPHLVDRQSPGVIAVDGTGRRFVNEATDYHRFVEAMHANSDAVPAFLVCDSRYLRRYGLGLARPGYDRIAPLVKAGYLLKDASLAGLARQMGVNTSNLESATTQMTQAAQTGTDEVFGKGSTDYNRYLGDPRQKPNPCLGPVDTAPYYAVKIWPGNIGTVNGLATDPHGRVLDTSGRPIPGLFACGNDMNSVMVGHYPGAGSTLGPALTFGYITAQTAAATPAT